jgi:hypothetical protein
MFNATAFNNKEAIQILKRQMIKKQPIIESEGRNGRTTVHDELYMAKAGASSFNGRAE